MVVSNHIASANWISVPLVYVFVCACVCASASAFHYPFPNSSPSMCSSPLHARIYWLNNSLALPVHRMKGHLWEHKQPVQNLDPEENGFPLNSRQLPVLLDFSFSWTGVSAEKHKPLLFLVCYSQIYYIVEGDLELQSCHCLPSAEVKL